MESKTKKSSRNRIIQKLVPYGLLSPLYFFIILFALVPTVYVFYYSFQNYYPAKSWINGFAGFDNFVTILTSDKTFWKSLLNSFKWIFYEVSLQFIFGMIFALVLNQKFRGRGLVRALIFAPWAISGVMVAILWSLIYNQNMGVLNAILQNLGLQTRPVAWLASRKTAFGAVVVAELWRGIPFFAISLLAALQNVDPTLYEACEIDGGGRVSKFLHVSWPAIRSTAILSSLLRCIWEFNSVDLIMNLTGGGPMGLTTTLSTYLADVAIKNRNFGYGSAIGVLMFLTMMIFAIVYLKVSGYGKDDD